MNDNKKPPASTGGQLGVRLPLSEYRDTIAIYPRGVKTKGYMPRFGKPEGSGGDRGDITGWSKNSRRRLRDWLLVNQPVGGVVIAATFTVPGEPLNPDDWRKLMKLLTDRLNRAKVGLVWRLELQKRGMPHLHCLAVPAPQSPTRQRRRRTRGVSDLHTPSDNVGLGLWLRCMWFELIDALPPSSGRVFVPDRGVVDVVAAPRSHLVGAREHAVDLSADEGDRWYRYLCDHTTKSKQEQISSWQGFRHWGIIYRPAFSEVAPSEEIRLPRRQYAAYYRQLRKLSRRRIPDARCPFGSRRAASPRRSCAGSAVWFGIAPALTRKLADWARSHIPPA